MNKKGTLSCSFCGNNQRDVKKLIAGPDVYICNECVELCNDIIAEEVSNIKKVKEINAVPTPRDIKKVLDEYIIGQDKAKVSI